MTSLTIFYLQEEQLPPEQDEQLLPEALPIELPETLDLHNERSLKILELLHLGQVIFSSLPKISSSNSLPQSLHLYS